MNILIVQFLLFCSIVLLVLGLNALRHGEKVKSPNHERPGFFGWFPDEIAAMGRAVEPGISALFPVESKRIDRELVVAALDGHLKRQDVRGLQGYLGASLFFVAALFILVATLEAGWAFVGGVVFGFLGYCYPPIWLARTARQRQDLISKELPFALDLLTVAMQAGEAFGSAIRHLVKEMREGPLRAEFRFLLRETGDLNKSPVDAMRCMADRIQVDEFRSLVTAVAQGEDLGASVVDSLKQQAEEIRRTRFHRAERKAARAPSLMLMPVALFILPSVFIVILTPVALRMLNTLHSAK